MGKYLDQCCNDAWDVIRQRKKIVGNKIIKINEDFKDKDIKESDYGWLAPNGTFYPVEFAKHQIWAANYIRKLYQNGNITIEDISEAGNGNHAGDWLVNRGWVLIHNPTQHKIQITRNDKITKAQKEFLYDYLLKHEKTEETNELFKGY